MQTKLTSFLKYSAIAVGLIGLTACATSPVPETISVNDGKKIGILVDASDFPTHTHLSISVLSRPFVKDLKVDWQIEEAIIQTLRDEIEGNTQFEVVNLRSLGINSTNDADIVRTKFGSKKLNNEVANNLKSQGVSVVVNIAERPTQASEYCPFETPSNCVALYSQGYGVVSQGHALGDNFYASASFKTQIESTNPPAMLNYERGLRGINSYFSTNRQLRYNEVPRSPKRITDEELEPFKREVLQHFSDMGKKIAVYLNAKAA